MSKYITGILIDVYNRTVINKTIVDELESYYDMLDCSTIDMQDRMIGIENGRQYTIVCDDEGLLKDNPKISALDDMGRPMFVGNLFIVNVDKEGNVVSLNYEDILYIEQFIQRRSTYRHPDPYPMLHQVEYL